MLDSIIGILISSGVIVTAFTGIFNLITLKSNNKTLKSIEEQKFKNELVQYRYIELHAYLKNISTREGVTYDIRDDEKTKITIQEATYRFHSVENEYKSIKALLDVKYSVILDKYLKTATEMSNAMVAHLHNNEEIDFNFIELLEARIEFEKMLIRSVQSQIQELIGE